MKKYCKENSLIPWTRLWINKPFIYEFPEFPLFYDRMKMNLVLDVPFFLSSVLHIELFLDWRKGNQIFGSLLNNGPPFQRGIIGKEKRMWPWQKGHFSSLSYIKELWRNEQSTPNWQFPHITNSINLCKILLKLPLQACRCPCAELLAL